MTATNTLSEGPPPLTPTILCRRTGWLLETDAEPSAARYYTNYRELKMSLSGDPHMGYIYGMICLSR